MTRLMIITREDATRSELRQGLARYDVACSFSSYRNGVREAIAGQRPDVLLFEVGDTAPDSDIRELIRKARTGKNLPVMALVPEAMLEGIKDSLEFDDFLVSPYDSRELMLRINRLLRRDAAEDDRHSRIVCDGLTIDLETCEVTVEGNIVELTYKEYELLKLLADHRGRVFTREALLDKIWGYDYYGGDRTVDVHVRRLRGKIEDATHTYIETVRNIGYRFIREA
ncbi:MAG: hypothetical protein A2Z05_07755 [Chloroflexi bacterium RBG_16_60_22]|nr:MAG: hypothetical protein A2Z05_07755 [Chloroflexi bacterium RBG_16_60_22]